MADNKKEAEGSRQKQKDGDRSMAGDVDSDILLR